MAEIEKIKPRSFQLSETNMELLEQVNKELGAATWNEVFTNLLQRFYDPIKVNDKNSEEIKSLRASNEDLRANLRDKIQHEKDLQNDLVVIKCKDTKLSQTRCCFSLLWHKCQGC